MRDDNAVELRDGMPFLGGRLWIDFLNSNPAGMGDLIATPEGLARWSRAAQIAPAPGPDDLAAAHRLRAALRQIFAALTGGGRVPPAALAEINGLLAAAPVRRQITAYAGGLRVGEVGGAATLLGAIATDLASFLGDYEAARLRHCANPDCTLVFYDSARNATRRWCSMAMCGNRRKVADHRARRKDRQAPRPAR